jgi:predicted MFS family arabinose efflux permease
MQAVVSSGPLVGGALSAAFGWRSTFLLLAALCGLLGALLCAFLPETHQHFTLKRLSDKDPARVASMPEAACVLAAKPHFQPPWAVLRYLYSSVYAPYMLANAWAHACLFAYLSLWPVLMAAAPHNLNEAAIG